MGTQVVSPVLEARTVREEFWNEDGLIQFPVEPADIAERLGIDVLVAPLEGNTAGFILREGEGRPQIVVNAKDSAVRQRFTLAHELGHYMQHREDDLIAYVDKRDELSTLGASPSEIWANQFAAELLMPTSVVKKWWAEGRPSEEMRERLGVSAQAMAFRLKNLGLLA
ncbi:ImmA/IrrE family metallo-endopeptidase [Leifsonia sp. NPDC014704]|uniref:ImmA/IrrE family metallo-endopeptidase n=1 Tax=Leifsonia sp. NPDC014704 TaxID=3364123 RepID=UPI0036F46B69